MQKNDALPQGDEISRLEHEIVKVGDRYLNSQDIELEVIQISQPTQGGDIIVELLPVDDDLIGRHWQGEFLLGCAGEAPCRHFTADEASMFPMLHFEDLNKLRRVL